MRTLLAPALLTAAIIVAWPAAAQNGPNRAPIPAPGYGGGQVSVRPSFQNGPQMRPPHAGGQQMRPPQGGAGQHAPNAGSRVWQNGRWMALPPSRNVARPNNPNRWGYQNGRWEGGNRAPGGWNAYRRLDRGHRLPGYWSNASFGINDYLSFGLSAPPYGYHWVRYYDDAVLVDGRGEVWDTVGGIGWVGGEESSGGSYSNSYSYSTGGGGYAQPLQTFEPDQGYYDEQQYSGGYGAQPGAPPVVQYQSYPQGYPQGGGYQSSSSSYYQGGGAYYAGGGGSTTTVVITSAPITTTTVTEETVTYVSAAPKRVWRAPVRKVRPKVKVKCCTCVCR